MGYSYVWPHPASVDPQRFAKDLQQRLEDQYVQSWTSEPVANSGRLRTYKVIKHEFKWKVP